MSEPALLRMKRKPIGPVRGLEALKAMVIGQPTALASIAPYVQMFKAGLAPAKRPAGVFLLLGPTGTGKTRTVEALAEALHGSSESLLRIDCGEFQGNHEVAKLIGAPPGYLGHRETTPILTQEALSSVASENCPLSLLLFDEIEKAADSMTRLLLGILDRGVLQTGSNQTVKFQNTLVFLTSNLGAREMRKVLHPELGFQPAGESSGKDATKLLERVTRVAIKKAFSPEFLNRIDEVVTYQPLDEQAFTAIVDLEIAALQRHVNDRLGLNAFEIAVSPAARRWLVVHGTSSEYGARELKRTLLRNVTQPLAALVSRAGDIAGQTVFVGVEHDRLSLRAA